MTSAPSQARSCVHDVPASNWVRSRTRMPLRALLIRSLLELAEGVEDDLGRHGDARDAGAEGAERVVHGVEDGAGSARHAALASALEAALGEGGRRFDVSDPDVGHFGGHWNKIIHQRGGEELTLGVVDAVLPQ